MELTKELVAKEKEAKTPEELMALAKENGIELTVVEATKYFEQLNPKCGVLDDKELDNVVGGGCGTIFQSPRFKNGAHVMEKGASICGTRKQDWRGAQRVMVTCDSPYLVVRSTGIASGSQRVYLVQCPKCGMSVTVHESQLKEV